MRQLLETIDSAELTEWLAYDQIEPFGPQREDLRTGLVCSTVANFSMSPPKKPHKPSDYMLFAEGRGQGDSKPVLLADPKSQSDLIRQAIFGMAPPTSP